MTKSITEAEARTKFCPLTFTVKQGVGFAQDGPWTCCTTNCMAWQFENRIHSRETELWSKSRNCKVNSAFSDDAEWRPVSGTPGDEPPAPVGYCSLMAPQGALR